MKCTRCEVLGREQQSDKLYYIGGFTPICSVCFKEITEEELYLINVKEYEQGSESIVEEDS